MSIKDVQTQVAVQAEQISNIEESITDLKYEIKEIYVTTDKKIDKLSHDMKKHMEQSQEANAKIVWYLLGGMGTIVLFLLGIMFK
jgi:predicted  nucleic acid-binding Zn-ribbon protein